MSNIRQSDVKKHLSPRFNTKIHLCQPGTLPDATGFAGEEPVGAGPTANDSTRDTPNLSTRGEGKPILVVNRKV
jgi:hypothetical protein